MNLQRSPEVREPETRAMKLVREEKALCSGWGETCRWRDRGKHWLREALSCT